MKLLDCESTYEMSLSFERFVVFRHQLLSIIDSGFLSTDELNIANQLVNIYSIAIDKYLFFVSKLKRGFYGINYYTKKVSIGVGNQQNDIIGIPSKANRAITLIFNQYLIHSRKPSFLSNIKSNTNIINSTWSFDYLSGL